MEVKLTMSKNKKMCIICEMNPVVVGQSYCSECRKDVNVKYRGVKQGMYLYKFLSIDESVIYCGSSICINQRLSNHFCDNQSSKTKAYDLVNYYKLRSVLVADVGDVVANRNELRYLENLLIENYKPILNNNRAITELAQERSKILDYYFNTDGYIDFRLFDIEKYLEIYMKAAKIMVN